MRKTILNLVLICISAISFAGNFTPGNIVILRVGSGLTTLSNASTAVYLDEYTVTGTLVQSIAVPAAVSGSNHALTLSGSAATEGELTLSPGGQYVTFTGFDTVPGYAGVSSGVTNRTIGRVDATGIVNTATGFLAGSAFVGGNFRSAVTNDGNEFWAAGSGGATGGIWYAAFGSFTASGVQTSATINTVRDVNIFGGQLYFTTSSAGVYTDGTGLPTATGQTETMLPGLPTADSTISPFAFLFLDESSSVSGLDVLYVADNTATGGIYKYSLVSGSWVSNGNIANASGLTGLTGFHSCHGTTLFASCATGVFTLTDTAGYNRSISGSYTQIVTAAANTLVHGIAFTPGSQIPTPPVVSIASKDNVTCFGQGNGSITTSLSGGYGTATYNWGSGITSTGRTNLSPGSYTVTVTDGLGCTASATTSISQPAVLALTDSVTNLPCTGGNTGAIKIAVTGGTSPYHYNWTPGSITTQNITGLTAGQYNVRVTDSLGCIIADSFHVSQSGSLVFSDSVIAPTCYGLANGSIMTTLTGGTPAYHYIWSHNNDTTTSISQLTGGSYTVTMTDQNGCTLIENINVTAPDSLSLALVSVNVSSFGGTDGSITLSVSGGTGSTYSYVWTNGATTQNTSNLVAGSYCVTVTDQHSCADSNCIDVTQPTGISDVEWISKFTTYTSGGNINIDFITTKEMNMAAELYDLTGQLIYKSAATYGVKLDLHISDATISSGAYVIRMNTDEGSICKKIIVIK